MFATKKQQRSKGKSKCLASLVCSCCNFSRKASESGVRASVEHEAKTGHKVYCPTFGKSK